MFQLQKTTQSDGETLDLSMYLVLAEWSGDVEQAGRKLEFDLAYTAKDKAWSNPSLELGEKIEFSFTDDKTKQKYVLFTGTVFSRSRESGSNVMHFAAFDDIIYLAKSRITKKYSSVTVSDAIKQTINDFNIKAGTFPDLSVVCSFIADNISATEAIKKALSFQSARDNKGYHIVMTDGKLNVISTNDRVVENFIISDETNLSGASAAESIEDMVSKVVVVDSAGEVKGTMENTTDTNKFGVIQTICKSDPKQNDSTAARSMLKTVAHDMSLKAIGYIQCIAGFSVDVEEEQLKGRFFIKSDTHRIEHSKHTMDLSLVFHKLLNEQKKELDSASYNTNPDYVPSPSAIKTSRG